MTYILTGRSQSLDVGHLLLLLDDRDEEEEVNQTVFTTQSTSTTRRSDTAAAIQRSLIHSHALPLVLVPVGLAALVVAVLGFLQREQWRMTDTTASQ